MSILSTQFDWIEEFPSSITVCDAQGIIIAMNQQSAITFEKSGGKSLIGKALHNCHPTIARHKLEELLLNPRTNSYTITKRGIKKFIHQSPWYEKGIFAGFVEISIEIPEEIPHFIR